MASLCANEQNTSVANHPQNEGQDPVQCMQVRTIHRAEPGIPAVPLIVSKLFYSWKVRSNPAQISEAVKQFALYARLSPFSFLHRLKASVQKSNFYIQVFF